MTADFLQSMGAASRARADSAKKRLPPDALAARAEAAPVAPPLRLGRFDVIAELKRVSPAAGELADESFSFENQLQAYTDGGAAAVSVLTEPTRFGGGLEDLTAAASLLRADAIPTMRKDFLVDPYQVVEARAAGAGGVLLIVALQTDAELEQMLETAQRWNLFVLLEAFDAEQLARADRLARVHDGEPLLIGVNCRDLHTLAVDPTRFEALAPGLPAERPAVAESGLKSVTDIRRVAGLGYGLALVGSALMQNDNPARTLRSFLDAGRKPCS